MLRIPSPVSLLLDVVVAGVRDIGLSAYRHEVVGTLILDHEPKNLASLADGVYAYREARVEDLAGPGVPLGDLLKAVPPEQGPRPR
jgi:hypothetical protein